MARKARFPIVAVFDGAGGAGRGTVEIDREAGTFTVRPLRRRKTYALALSTVATLVCWAIILAEHRERRAADKKKGTKRRGVSRRTP